MLYYILYIYIYIIYYILYIIYYILYIIYYILYIIYYICYIIYYISYIIYYILYMLYYILNYIYIPINQSSPWGRHALTSLVFVAMPWLLQDRQGLLGMLRGRLLLLTLRTRPGQVQLALATLRRHKSV